MILQRADTPMWGTPSHQRPAPTGTLLQAGAGRHSTRGAEGCTQGHAHGPPTRRSQGLRARSRPHNVPHACSGKQTRGLPHNCSLLDAKDSHVYISPHAQAHKSLTLAHTLHTAHMDTIRAESVGPLSPAVLTPMAGVRPEWCVPSLTAR